jgi:aminoglycoside phosphotransferase (APT) family kinase protein
VRRKAAAAEQVVPELAHHFAEAAEALAARCPVDSELVPTHGDFNLRNVLMAKDRAVLLDWDRFHRADPARDMGFLGAWFWVSLLREGREPDWCVLDEAVAIYERLRRGASLRERLDFHAAAGLVRIAFSRVRTWPEEIRLVPAITAEALRRVA